MKEISPKGMSPIIEKLLSLDPSSLKQRLGEMDLTERYSYPEPDYGNDITFNNSLLLQAIAEGKEELAEKIVEVIAEKPEEERARILDIQDDLRYISTNKPLEENFRVGNTALTLAIKSGYYDLATKISRCGASAFLAPEVGRFSPLHLAVLSIGAIEYDSKEEQQRHNSEVFKLIKELYGRIKKESDNRRIYYSGEDFFYCTPFHYMLNSPELQSKIKTTHTRLIGGQMVLVAKNRANLNSAISESFIYHNSGYKGCQNFDVLRRQFMVRHFCGFPKDFQEKIIKMNDELLRSKNLGSKQQDEKVVVELHETPLFSKTRFQDRLEKWRERESSSNASRRVS